MTQENTAEAASLDENFDFNFDDEVLENDDQEAEKPIDNIEPKEPDAELPEQPEQVEQVEALEPPEYFTKEQKEAFKAIQDRAAQEAWVNQYTEHQDYINQKLNEIDKNRQNLETFNQYQQALQPLSEIWQKNAVHPAMGLAQMAHYGQMLYSNPQQLIQEIATQTGIDLTQLVEDQPYIDPQTRSLQQEVQQLRATIGQLRQGQANQSAQVIHNQIAAFADEKDSSGNLAHPYFEKVAPVMTQLLQIQDNDINDLKSAYDYAIQYSPEIQKEIQAQQEKEKAKARQAEATKAKAAAKKVNSKSKDAPKHKPTINELIDDMDFED